MSQRFVHHNSNHETSMKTKIKLGVPKGKIYPQGYTSLRTFNNMLFLITGTEEVFNTHVLRSEDLLSSYSF